MVDSFVKCADCEYKLDESYLSENINNPCPNCGSKERFKAISIHEKGSAHEQLEIKMKIKGKKNHIMKSSKVMNYI